MGATSNIGDLVTTWEDDCNQSSAAESMVVPLWYFLGILRNSNFGNSIPTSKNYIEVKKGWKFRKGFQNMEVKIICTNLVFMDLINPFGVSGDVIDISICTIHISWILGTQNCNTWLLLLKLQLKTINEQNHKRALGAKEGVPNEDSTWEYVQIL